MSFGALAASVWLREPLGLLKVSGLLLGFVGVAVLVGLGPIPLTPPTLIAIGLSLAAAVSYGVAAVYTKARIHGAEPRAVATYSQLFAALLLLPVAPFVLPQHAPTAVATGSLLALALLCTALAYLLYFYLIFKIGPTRATMVTYLSPVFGTLWGVLLLHESLGVGALAGFGLVLAGVGLVSGGRVRERISG
jgi:drug/metabolite transporter (DMT)-like permease